MFKILLGVSSACILALMLTGCNKSESGSANASADKAASEAKEKQKQAERDLQNQKDADKARADKEAKEKEAADKLAASRREETTSLAKAKEEIGKLFDLPAIEAAIAKLPTDKQALAKSKLADFKKMWGDFMNEQSGSKMSDWKDKLSKSYDDLKKASGL